MVLFVVFVGGGCVCLLLCIVVHCCGTVVLCDIVCLGCCNGGDGMMCMGDDCVDGLCWCVFVLVCFVVCCLLCVL